MRVMDTSIRKVRVIVSRVRDHIETVHFSPGDTVSVGHRNQQFPEFLWVATEHGLHGWAPEAYLRMTGHNEAVALREYDAGQLTVVAGETLDVLDNEGGWLQCRNATGVMGWVPVDDVEDL
jgi:SH3 domain